MDRWAGKVAVVTGASAGIGLAIAKSLLKNGMIVIGLARRSELIKERINDVANSSKLYAKKCDVSNEEEIKMAFLWIKDTFKNVHVLVNNAGTLRMDSLLDIPIKDIEMVLNLNLMGPIHCTREAAKLMKQSDDEAIIINMNSYWCHMPPTAEMNIHPATKYALKAVSEICRKEFIKHKNIRVANISPGMVKTEIFKTIDIPKVEDEPMLNPEDVAKSVLHIISAPAHVNITELMILPTGSSLP